MKALVQRYNGKPFAIVGVNTDRDKSSYYEQMEEYGLTWQSAWQGSTDGPIPNAWGIDSYPTVYVLDQDHVIRAVNARGDGLEKVVDELMAKLEAE